METYQRENKSFEILGEMTTEYKKILSQNALEFIFKLHQKFEDKRQQFLNLREKRQKEFDNGKLPGFLRETKKIRDGIWTISPIPKEVEDRRVEITGPAERKMMINALNSGANTFMADLEDSTSPTWENIIQSQINLKDAVNKTISFQSKEGKTYQLNDKTAILMVRPRGWHLNEGHIKINGDEISASLFDFGLYAYHNAKTLVEKGTRPYFYLPKMESYLEARLWNEVFCFAQEELNIPKGTFKSTVLIETITAAFEMDEILYELKDHILGLNCGRWDYIFSCIKKLRSHPNFILPNRQMVTMTVPFMENYSLLAIQTCHRRNAQAIGGMAAQIPIKDNPKANEEAFEKVYADKKREAKNGHDGTWVAHPALVSIAKKAFDEFMPEKNQIGKIPNANIMEEDLLPYFKGEITEEGLRININVGLQYMKSWLMGKGAVPIYHLMEDAATAEISRSQIWQWIHHPSGKLNDGRDVDAELVQTFIDEEANKIESENNMSITEYKKLMLSKSMLEQIVFDKEFAEFLTLKAYKKI